MYVVWSTMKFPTGPCIRLSSSYWYKKPRPSTCRSFQPHVLHDHNLLGLCSHHDLHGHRSLLSEKWLWVRSTWAFLNRGFKRDPQNLRGSISQVGRSIHPKRCKWIATYLVCNPLRPIVRCSLCACICFTSVINGMMALISSYTCLPSAICYKPNTVEHRKIPDRDERSYILFLVGNNKKQRRRRSKKKEKVGKHHIEDVEGWLKYKCWRSNQLIGRPFRWEPNTWIFGPSFPTLEERPTQSIIEILTWHLSNFPWFDFCASLDDLSTCLTVF